MKLRWRRILTSFAIMAVGAAYICFPVFDAPLLPVDLNDPTMWKVPAALPGLSIAMTPGLKLSYFGYEFDVPWNDLDPKKTRPIGKPPWQWQMICFRSGRTIMFIRHPASRWSKALFSPKDSYVQRTYMSWTFGADASSDYAFTRAMLEATPDQLTSFMLRFKRDRLTTLLLLKSVDWNLSGAKSGLFMIDTATFRGFQYGNPQGHPTRIEDVLYADNRSVEFSFRFCPPSPAISQADINRVIQTVRATAAPAPATSH
jgi:hypothetical protein